MAEKNRMHIETLLKKAADATDAAQAMNYAQAACNAANALRALADIKRIPSEEG
jgi:hypothetical protein